MRRPPDKLVWSHLCTSPWRLCRIPCNAWRGVWIQFAVEHRESVFDAFSRSRFRLSHHAYSCLRSFVNGLRTRIKNWFSACLFKLLGACRARSVLWVIFHAPATPIHLLMKPKVIHFGKHAKKSFWDCPGASPYIWAIPKWILCMFTKMYSFCFHEWLTRCCWCMKLFLHIWIAKCKKHTRFRGTSSSPSWNKKAYLLVNM